jgi:hypothetical protein
MENINCITDKNNLNDGLFGMVILFMFEVLPILEKNNVDVTKLKWDICTTNYGNIFPNLLQYNSEYTNPDEILEKTELLNLRDNYPQYVLGDDFNKLNSLFFKYFTIPKELDAIAESYNLNNSLGIHFRGTDKTSDNYMNNPLTIDEFYIIIDSFLKNNTNLTNIFIATDEQNIVEYLKNKYSYITIVTSRNFNKNLFWKNNDDIISNGQEAMIDMLCLSKCKTVLKVSSALSAFSKVVNPNLNIFRLNASNLSADIPYFPDAYIPLLEKNENYTEECNKILDKVQLHDWSVYHKTEFNNFYYKLR